MGGYSSFPKGGHFQDFQHAAKPGFGEDAERRRGQAVPGHDQVQHEVSEGAGLTIVAQTSAREGLQSQRVDLGMSDIHLSLSDTDALVSELARKVADIDTYLDRLLGGGPRLVVPPGSGTSCGTVRASVPPCMPSQVSSSVCDFTPSALEGEIVARELADPSAESSAEDLSVCAPAVRLLCTPADLEEMHRTHSRQFHHYRWCPLCDERKRALAHRVAEAMLRAQASLDEDPLLEEEEIEVSPPRTFEELMDEDYSFLVVLGSQLEEQERDRQPVSQWLVGQYRAEVTASQRRSGGESVRLDRDGSVV